MESLDQQIEQVLADLPTPSAIGPAKVLVVGDEPLGTLVASSLTHHAHRCSRSAGLNEAKAVVARTRFDVIVLWTELAGENIFELAPIVQKTSPTTKLVVVAPAARVDAAVQAVRCGAVDFILLPVDQAEMRRRIEAALIKARVDRQREDRITRLKKICRELNCARHEITKQVDGLCGDLVSAYKDIAEQLNDVAMATEFRTLLKQELDVEDLLRTTLEYLLTKTGPTNAAVFLPDADQHYGLGAYVNYDCPRETIASLLDHLCHAICPQMADEADLISFDDSEDFAHWIGADASFLAESQVVAFSCRSRSDCLAIIVLFRNKSNPFDENLAMTLEVLRAIIGEQLANVIRIHHRARPSWPKEAAADGEYDSDDDLGFGYEGGLAA